MRFAYADPPYPGAAKKWYSDDPRCHEVNQQVLVETIHAECPDGWALSTSSNGIRLILPHCPPGTRVLAWVKPFAFTLPVYPKYTWEPVIFFGGRKQRSDKGYARDSLIQSPTAVSSVGRDPNALRGAKPRAFCRWLFDCWGVEPGDTLWDVFPGSGAVTAAFREYQGESDNTGLPLFDA